MIIEVTQKHINKGYRYSRYQCPIALALSQQIGGTYNVYGQCVGNGEKQYRMTRSMARFIENFDEHGKKRVRPFRFRLIPL